MKILVIAFLNIVLATWLLQPATIVLSDLKVPLKIMLVTNFTILFISSILLVAYIIMHRKELKDMRIPANRINNDALRQICLIIMW